MAAIEALEAKIKVFNNQLESAKRDAADFEAVEDSIRNLLRTKEQQEKHYRYLVDSVDQARIDVQVDPSKSLSNISVVQEPSPPLKDRSELKKPLMIAFAVPIVVGIGLALLLELLMNQTVKTPREVEQRFRLPLFLTIPDLKSLGRGAGQRSARERMKWKHKLPQEEGKQAQAEIAPWDSEHELKPFCEGLRDRILLHFEGVTRRPKLIGITSCVSGSGATTIAAGLAAALSESGDGNVLLVDLNLDHGSAHPFFRGKPSCGLADSLEQEKRSEALIQDNLFLASAGGSNGKMFPVHSKSVVELMPRLRASDYDYVIFDLPPVSPTSLTFRLAGYMDRVLLILESGKTHRQAVSQSVSLLQHGKAKVAAILNRHRTCVPQWLDPGS
jgi:Mrp family chromosome partitioning ATPase